MSREPGAQETEENTNHHLVVLENNGQKPRAVIRSEHFGAQNTSINIGKNTGAYVILAHLILSEDNNHGPTYFSRTFKDNKMPIIDLWMLIRSFAFDQMPYFNRICHAGLIKPSLFSLATCDSAEVVNAVFDADEITVCRMLSAISIPTKEDPTGLNKLRTILCTKEPKTGVTPLQAALRTGDIAMAWALKPYFDQLPGGPQEMAAQIKEVFPNGLEAFEACQKKEADDFFKDSGIEVAFNKKSNTPADIQNALNSFKEKLSAYLETHPAHNPFILLKAFEIYEKNFDPWTVDQLRLFSQQVIGLIQKHSPNVWKQHYAQGIYYLTEKNEVAKRSFNLRDSSTDIRSVVGLGSSCCINIGGERCGLGGWDGCGGSSGCRGVWKSYVEQKHQAWKTYAVSCTEVNSQLRNDVA